MNQLTQIGKRGEVFFLVMFASIFVLAFVFALTLNDTITGMATAEQQADSESDIAKSDMMNASEKDTLTPNDSSSHGTGSSREDKRVP